MPKTIVILNPAAGRGRAADLAARMRAWLSAHMQFEWAETNEPAHAIEIV